MTEPLTALEASQVLRDAQAWDSALARRTEGLTFLVWGTVTPGIIVTMGFVSLVGLPAWSPAVAWPPWVLVGFAFTALLWRTARLTRADLPQPGVLGYVVRVAVILACILVLHFVVKPTGMAWPLGFIGLGWVATGFFTRRLTVTGRRTAAAVGIIILAAALILPLLRIADMQGMLYAAAVTGAAPVAAGIWQTLR